MINTNDVDSASAVVILVPDLIGHGDGLQLLHVLGLLAHVHQDALVDVQDEAVTIVHRRDLRFHLQGKTLFSLF
jgi:hypothetical protein